MDKTKFEDRAGELMLVPLSRLVASPKRNVRKKRTSAEYRARLKASIAAQGVLQNLVVCPAVNGKGKETGDFEVVGGEQRRSVLVELAICSAESPSESLIGAGHGGVAGIRVYEDGVLSIGSSSTSV